MTLIERFEQYAWVGVLKHLIKNNIFTTASDGSNAGLAVIDGLSASSRMISNAAYSDTDILAVKLITVTGDTLVLSPKSGDTDYTLDATDLAALGAGDIIYGRWDSITSTGVGCKVLAFID